MPDIAGAPVVYGRSHPDIFELVADPAGFFVTVFPVQKTAVTLQRFISANTQQAYCFFVAVRDTVPPAELFGQVFLMHTVTIGRHRVIFDVDHIFVLRHRPDPGIFFGVVPGIPVHFVAAERRPCRHRQADPIRLHIFFDPCKGPFDVFCGSAVLRFKILMKNADAFIRIMCLLKIKHQIEQQTTVFTAGK